MTFPQPDVHVLATPAFLEDRLRLYPGTRPAASISYDSGAYVPLLPPRRLDNAEIAEVGANRSALRASQTVQIVQAQPHFAEAFRAAFDLTASALPTIGASSKQNAAYGSLLQDADAFGRYLSEDGGAHLVTIGLSTRAPDLTTSTSDPESRNLIGLHIDSFSGYDVSTRAAAPRRLCFNVGNEDRHFLFLGMTFQRCISLLASKGINIEDGPDHNNVVVEHFMQEFPSSPVYELRVKPNEAYLAPTENIIHDSHTVGRTSLDVTFSLLGHFYVDSV